MAKKSKNKRSSKRRNPAAELTDDLLVEILSRLPAKSVCRCRCVSRRWDGLIADPHHRKKLPQTLAGFFCRSENEGRFPEEAQHFVNVTGRGRPRVHPSLSFLPRLQRVRVVDSCGGLLLCRCYVSAHAFRYVVCNPSTDQWVALPESGYCPEGGGDEFCTRLGFDPAVSSHFHVFEFVIYDGEYVDGVKIFSSATRGWNYSESKWFPEYTISYDQRSVFFNGILYMITGPSIVAVDAEGATWWDKPVLEMEDEPDMIGWWPCFIGKSQGKVFYFSERGIYPFNRSLSIWVLEDYSKDEWTWKHNVTTEELSEKINCKCKTGFDFDDLYYFHVVTVHPDCNLIYYSFGRDRTLMAYDMDSEESHVIQKLGSDFKLEFVPYVPFY
ncbi:F-box protein At5g07610-like [Oryza brachyantha]|uniref:F-box protein At5g07610-like n=1 Tax=Oryza brachyantha TaxID=4533 RepID=UPI001ADBC338|nr:F-box protein At5g07610-like [Oryza brachyantha]